MKSIILVLLLIASGSAQAPPILKPLEFRSGRASIVIPQRDSSGPHDWHAASCHGGIEKSVLHAFVRRMDTLYVLFQCEGWSRGTSQPQGRCGSGWERQINWMAIRDGIVVEHQQRDIMSCWHDAEGSIDGWHGDQLFWSVDTPVEFCISYFDRNAPEKGIQIKERQKNDR